MSDAHIFRQGVPASDPPRPRTPKAKPAPLPPVPVAVAVHPSATTFEALVVSIIESPLCAGETCEVAYRRKEEQLRALFGQLSVQDARSLHRRLSSGEAKDAIVRSFNRLVAERRGRLLAFLSDVRRREAIASARRA